MNSTIKTIIFIVVLLAIAYFLTPYVKIKPKNDNSNSNNNNQQAGNSTVQTFNSDNLGISFKFDTDQDGDGTADTKASETGDKVFVYYQTMQPEMGQWVQEFHKDANVSLQDAIKTQFLKDYNPADCYPMDLKDYYSSYDVPAPTIADNVEEAVIAYPKTTDPNVPYWQNSEKCPTTYTVANGISYFYLDKNHPDKYFFFNIGQYGIIADPQNMVPWQDTFAVTK